jgi:hypothetical protein
VFFTVGLVQANKENDHITIIFIYLNQESALNNLNQFKLLEDRGNGALIYKKDIIGFE